MRNYGANKHSRPEIRRRRTSREGLLMLAQEQQHKPPMDDLSPDSEDEHATGVWRCSDCWEEFGSAFNCQASLITHRCCSWQRLADFSEHKSNESGLFDVCAGDSSQHTQSQKLGVDLFVRSMVRGTRIDLTDIVDLGDQMWHKVAGMREKKARDFILHDDTEEYLALLAITIEVMRLLTGWLLFCSASWHGDSKWSMPPRCSCTHSHYGTVFRALHHIS